MCSNNFALEFFAKEIFTTYGATLLMGLCAIAEWWSPITEDVIIPYAVMTMFKIIFSMRQRLTDKLQIIEFFVKIVYSVTVVLFIHDVCNDVVEFFEVKEPAFPSND